MYFQDFLAVPVGAKNYADALNMLSRVRSAASDMLAEDCITTLLADEGGLSPGYSSSAEAFQLMIRTFERAELRTGHDRSEESRVGKEFVSQCIIRWTSLHEKKKQ